MDSYASNDGKYDIIVIGAGPGGSSSAMIAVENGFSVCVLEKEKIEESGRYKACGGAIAWEVVEELKYPEDLIERKIESLELHHISGETYSKKGKGATICRSVFDKYLVDEAVRKGAILKDRESMVKIERTGEFYTVRTQNEEYKCKYIIAADGVNSRALSILKFPKFDRIDLVLTITQELKSNKIDINTKLGSEKVHLFFGIKDFIPMGYAWLFPKKDIITLGWGNRSDFIKNYRDEFKKFLNLDIIRDTTQNSRVLLEKPHLIPVGLRSKIYDEGVFAVGDAGGFVDPISGKGIPYAMLSGKIAAKAIKYGEEKGKDKIAIGKRFQRKLESEFLTILKAKKLARERIFQSDENLKKFLSLWERFRSSQIVVQKMI